jgi:NADP-dependent 3-hydroxy acid dehydrogenase YdfG
MSKKTVVMVGISSDIGRALAEYYFLDGYAIAGTYRHKNTVNDLWGKPNIYLFQCDLRNTNSMKRIIEQYNHICEPWDIFISCVGSMEPIGNFFACDFDAWEKSVIVNSIAQLRFLHGMYPYRSKGNFSHVVFFADGRTEGTFTNYSAYCVSKILLIKMCELLDDENKDLNVFIIGPGWVRTKIHKQTLDNALSAGQNYNRTVEFLQTEFPGTSTRDIYNCINWCIEQGREIVGGRNFSVVHDYWGQNRLQLAKQLRNDQNKFKLRRFRNKPLY